MRSVQIIRQAMNEPDLGCLKSIAKLWLHVTESGTHRQARYYDDMWPLNLSGVEGVDLPFPLRELIEQYLGPDLDMTHSLILYTTRYPHLGKWHHDAPPYEDDTICLLCVDGLDELEYKSDVIIWPTYLMPGDLCLLPAATWHRAKCSTHRITWHVRVGPKGKTLPESKPSLLPPMSLRRFVSRTVRTARYYLLNQDFPT